MKPLRKMSTKRAEPIVIREYEGLTCARQAPGYACVSEATFKALRDFILAPAAPGEADGLEVLGLSARRGVGEVLIARNHVGLITLDDGTGIEILPRIAGHVPDAAGRDATRKIFLKMLQALDDPLYKQFSFSRLAAERCDLLEIFIGMFLGETARLVSQGLRAAYRSVERNERVYKGKLLHSRHLRQNLVRRDRFFLRHDEFSMDRPENRLIKTTLARLRGLSRTAHNRTSAARLLGAFDGVGFSARLEEDFASCRDDRCMTSYARLLPWCRVFLRHEGFTAFSGPHVALSLLFPMEKLFESYIGALARKHCGNGMRVRLQERRHSLFAYNGQRLGALRPDIVLSAAEDGDTAIVLDTKWKLLESAAPNYGVSQADLYQMYAYGKKYAAKRVVLIYPQTDDVSIDPHTGFTVSRSFDSGDGVTVDMVFLDLKHPQAGIPALLEALKRAHLPPAAIG